MLALRTALFPNNAPAPVAPPPSAAEIRAIRRRCATTIIDAIPHAILVRFLGPETRRSGEGNRDGGDGGVDPQRGGRWIRDVEEGLDVFGTSYMNKHLLYAITELIVLRVFPEMAEKGVEELMAERLG